VNSRRRNGNFYHERLPCQAPETEGYDQSMTLVVKERARAFVSYSHADRHFAGEAKQLLDAAGFSAFLAHEDLEVSDEWRDCLLSELRQCRLFVPLFSKNYIASVWATQESGFIVSRLPDVVVAALSLDGTRSSGFLSHFQSPSIPAGRITREVLIEPLTARFPRTILPRAIAAVVEAKGFRQAESLMKPLVRFFPLFTADEAQAFAEGAVRNSQIWLADLCRTEYLPALIALQGSNIQPRTLRALSHQVEHEEWYRGD
jgi:hypothetical protein